MPESEYLTIPEVSKLTGLSRNTLYYYRHQNIGPPCYKLGRKLIYPAAELEQWAAARRAKTLRGAVA
jgi:predicted DNA-binding transcriptional regulator AlpA